MAYFNYTASVYLLISQDSHEILNKRNIIHGCVLCFCVKKHKVEFFIADSGDSFLVNFIIY